MLIRLKKLDAGVVLTCLRDHGDAAVQRTAHGGFFALHDLLHYAVETTLGFDRAFFGLMSAGWDFATFGDRTDPRYRSMPAQAVQAEHLVGVLSRVYGDPAWRDPELLPMFAEDVNRELSAALGRSNVPAPVLTADQLVAIYTRLTELAQRWVAVPLGGHLELPFPGGPSASLRHASHT